MNVFFENDGRLLSLVAPTESESLAQRAARALLAADGNMSIREHASALLSFPARRRRAAILLIEILRREQRGDWRGVERLWPICELEWQALSGSKLLKTWLLSEVAANETTDSSAVAAEVCNHIKTELLPGVLLICEISAADSAPSAHRRWLQQTRRELCPNGIASGTIAEVAIDVLVGEARATACLEGQAKLLAAAGQASKLLDRHSIIEEFNARATRWFNTRKSASTAELEALHTQASVASTLAPNLVAPLQLRARLRVSMAILAAKYDAHKSAAEHVAEAQLVDPTNGDADALAEAIISGLTTLRQQLTDMICPPAVVLNEGGQRLLREAAQAIELLNGSPHAERRRIAEVTFGESLAANIALRLGLAPTDQFAREAALALATLATEDLDIKAIQLLLEDRFPVLRQASWDQVEIALRPLPAHPIQFLEQLPNLPTRAVDLNRLETIRATLRCSIPQSVPHKQKLDTTVFFTWALSTSDWLPKSAAIVGLLLCLGIAEQAARRHWHTHARDQAYATMLVALTAQSTTDTRRAANEFLRHLEDSASDSREEEVVDLYQRALLHEIAATSDKQQRTQLLGEARSLEGYLTSQDTRANGGEAQ